MSSAGAYVGYAAVYVAELANVQKAHSMLGVIESKCSSGVNWYCAAIQCIGESSRAYHVLEFVFTKGLLR